MEIKEKEVWRNEEGVGRGRRQHSKATVGGWGSGRCTEQTARQAARCTLQGQAAAPLSDPGQGHPQTQQMLEGRRWTGSPLPPGQDFTAALGKLQYPTRCAEEDTSTTFHAAQAWDA